MAARLDECLQSRLTLVSAPAGFGKTTLVAWWAQGLDAPVAWVSLDEADNDPARFLVYLLAALRKIYPEVGRGLEGEVEASASPGIEGMVGALINDLATLPADFVLVLDDYHTIEDASIHKAVQDLVAYEPARMHLLIATREDPPLPLARLRARAELVELRAQDLRFEPDETAAFLTETMGLVLDVHDIRQLDARIEGWVAGLQLAALSMRQRSDKAEFIAGLAGTHHSILSYLTEEVIRRQPAEVRQFLLETSVLSRLTGPLCDQVTGRAGSDVLLDRLSTSNAFVSSLDDEHVWYRYHHLFGDLLIHQLSRTRPELVPELHRRAGEWYERQGLPAEAIEQALAARDYERAVSLLEAHAREVTLQGHARTVENWLRRLPREWRVAGPQANLAFGWSLLLRGLLAETYPYIEDAEAAAVERARAGAPQAADAIMAEARALRAIVTSVLGDADDACELARQAVALAPKDDLVIQGLARFSLGTTLHYAGKAAPAVDAYLEALPACQASGNSAASMLIFANLASLYMVQGQLHAAADVCQRAFEEAEKPHGGGPRSPSLGPVYSNYSSVLYEWGDLKGAQRLADQGLERSGLGGHVASLAIAAAVVSRVRLALGDRAGAETALDHAAQIYRQGLPAWVAPQVITQQVALALARGNEEEAARSLARTGVGIEQDTGAMNEAPHVARLRLLHYLGRGHPLPTGGAPEAPASPQRDYLGSALDLASRLLAWAETAGRMGRVIEILTLRALVYQARGELGDTGRSLDDLGRALELAEPEGYLRLFINEGPPMAHLLEVARLRGIEPAYAARLLAAFPASQALEGEPPRSREPRVRGTALAPRPGLIEPLTGREIDVLRLMSEGLTYGEVAQRLVVSLNTVRFHVKGIYGKLSVEKRSAAVDRARSLGLL